MTDASLQSTYSTWTSNTSDSLPDPWLQGLGVFDLTAMEWKDRYDPAAAPYVTPDAVKAFYHMNGRGPAKWTNDLVQAWFTKHGSNLTNSSSTPSNPAPGPPILSRPPGLPRSYTSAIVGSTVGSIATLALLTLIAFLLRRRRGRSAVSPPALEHRETELGKTNDGRSPSVQYPPTEMEGNNNPIEMPQREVSTTELPAPKWPKQISRPSISEMKHE